MPSGTLRAAQLQDGKTLTTALNGAPPLRVDRDDGELEIESRGGWGDDDGVEADVVRADIAVGNSVIHVVDEVLIPASLRAARSG